MLTATPGHRGLPLWRLSGRGGSLLIDNKMVLCPKRTTGRYDGDERCVHLLQHGRAGMLQAIDVEDHIIMRATCSMRLHVQEAAEWVEAVAVLLAALSRLAKCWALRLRPFLRLCRQHYEAPSASWVLLPLSLIPI